MAFASLNNDRFCRTYEGSLPVLGVTDPEIVREVMIKQFDVFPNRTTRTSPAIKYMRKMIVIMQHDEWKRTRSALSPTFTGAKLKKMVAVMNDVASNFSRKLFSSPLKKLKIFSSSPFSEPIQWTSFATSFSDSKLTHRFSKVFFPVNETTVRLNNQALLLSALIALITFSKIFA